MTYHWREYLSEFFGTAILLLVGISGIALNFSSTSFMPQLIPNNQLRLLLTGFIFAGGATLVVYSPLGKQSGGHINPAVTLSFWILNKIKWRDALAYTFMQFGGASLGALLAFALLGEAARSVNLGMTLPAIHYSVPFVFFAEFTVTALLVMTIVIFTSVRRVAPFTGVAVGLLVALIVYFESPISGTGINPARSFGPALVMNNFKYFWIYFTAPLLAAVTTSFLFKAFLYKPMCGKLYHPSARIRCIFNCNF